MNNAPQMTTAEARQHATFTALMWALSYPGRAQRLPASGLAAFAHVAEALLDLETGFYCSDTQLAAQLAHSGARQLPPEAAPYQLYPQLDAAALAAIARAPLGSYADPEDGATLVLGCTLGSGQALRLRGPGIAEQAGLRVGRLPAAFWELRARAVSYPLGWDCFLLGENYVVGLPRTTLVEVC
jgi:alpha-D-ribose 1-methylphosphonate 5-triphosphate synthase subunit PhnH